MEDPDNPPPEKRHAGRPLKRPPPPREEVEEEDEMEPPAARRPAVERHTRKFQSTWKTVLPWLIFAAGVCVCPSAEGDRCPGCKFEGIVICTLCMEHAGLGPRRRGVEPFHRRVARLLQARRPATQG